MSLILKTKSLSNFILILIFSNSIFSQITTKKVDELCLDSKVISDFGLQLLKIDSAYNISKSINYKQGMLSSKLLKAAWYMNSNSNIKPCLEIIREIESDILHLNDCEKISHLKLIKGMSYMQLYFNDQAEKELYLALEFANKINNENLRRERRGIIFMATGKMFFEIQSSKKNKTTNISALKNFKNAYKELSLIKNSNRYQRMTFANSANVLGHFYITKGKLNVAKHFLIEALQICRELNDYAGLAYNFSLSGTLNFKSGNFRNAIKNYNESNRIIKLMKGEGPFT